LHDCRASRILYLPGRPDASLLAQVTACMKRDLPMADGWITRHQAGKGLSQARSRILFARISWNNPVADKLDV
jgi:hypothetical protein